jgi:hypothetical protein
MYRYALSQVLIDKWLVDLEKNGDYSFTSHFPDG